MALHSWIEAKFRLPSQLGLLCWVLLAFGLATCRAETPASREMHCNNPVAYDGRNIAGEAALTSIFSASAGSRDVALRDPEPAVERYYAALSALCEQLNSGVLSRAEYVQRADGLTHSLMGELHPTDTQERQFHSVYAQLVKHEAPPLEFDFTMLSKLPWSGQEFIVRPNHPVPTGAQVRFSIRANRAVHVYMLQQANGDQATALYPHARLALSNPLPADRQHSIPPVVDQWFEVDAQNVGIEKVYIVAALEPLPKLENALRHLASAGTSAIGSYDALEVLTTLRPGYAGEDCSARGLDPNGMSASCTRTRGLVLVGGEDNLAPQAQPELSLRVKASPGDSMVVKVFPWQHVPREEFSRAIEQYTAPTAAARKSRGIMVEDP